MRLIILFLCLSLTGYGQSLIKVDAKKRTANSGVGISSVGVFRDVVYQEITLYSVNGGGSGWEEPGFPIYLSGSDVGTDYIVRKESEDVYINKDTVSGTGSAMNFGYYDSTGVYNILALKNGITRNMNRSATLDIIYYNTYAKNLFARLDSTTISRKRAISTFFSTVNNFIPRVDILYGFANYTSGDAVKNWVSDSFNASINDNPIFTTNRGFKNTTGGTSSLRTGYVPATHSTNFALDSSSLMAYVVNDTNETVTSYSYGTSDGTNKIIAHLRYSNQWYRVYHNSSGYITPGTNGNSIGFYGLTTWGDSISHRKNDVYAKKALVKTNLPTTELYLLALNNNGTVNTGSNKELAFFILGDYFSNNEISIWKDAIESYLSSTGTIEISNFEYINYETDDYTLLVYPTIEILAQRDSVKLYATSDSLYFDAIGNLSSNNSVAFDSDNESDPYNDVNMSWIFENRLIVFAKGNQIYYSNDSLQTFDTLKVNNYINGGFMTPHTPINEDYPGNYYKILQYPTTDVTINDTTYLYFGNYCNVVGGAAPVNIYQLKQYNDTVICSLVYQFGQYRVDDGTTTGTTVGTLKLGNPDNPLLVRHIHAINYDTSDSSWYATTGDQTAAVKWMKHKYSDPLTKWENIITSNEYVHFKTSGIYFNNDTVIIGSDAASPIDQVGIFKSKISELADTSKHIRSLQLSSVVHGLIGNGTEVIALDGAATSHLFRTNNFGSTWQTIDMSPHIGNYLQMVRTIRNKDSDGYYLLESDNLLYKSFLIKFK